MEHRVAITGIGAVTPLGNTAKETWEGMVAGRCGIGPITHFDTEAFKVKVAAEVKDFDGAALLGKQEAAHLDLFSQYALVASDEAMAAADAAAKRESELRQRIETLETTLAAKESAPAEASAESPDAITFAILSKEADCLRKGQDEEQLLLDRLREITRARMLHFSERLLEIRKLMGDSPEHMREMALRDGRIASLSLRNMPNERAHELEKSLSNALSRESELQKRLVALESREQDLRGQMEAAEQRTLDSARLGEKLRETAAAFDRERRARDADHQEFMHIQEQLLRRIEELERSAGTFAADAADFGEPPSAKPTGRGSAFGWLRQK